MCVCINTSFSVILGVLSVYLKQHRRHSDVATDWTSVETWLDSQERQNLHVCPNFRTGSLVYESVYTVSTMALFWKSRCWALKLATNPLLVSKSTMTGATQPLYHKPCVFPGAKFSFYLPKG
jgi:hypothetical protein